MADVMPQASFLYFHTHTRTHARACARATGIANLEILYKL